MAIIVSDYVDVRKRAQELGLNDPGELSILPRNYDVAKSKEDLLFESTTPTVRILLRQADIKETRIEKKEEKLPQISEKHFIGWVGPIIFVSASLLSQNPALVSITLGVISNYLTDFLKGTGSEKQVKLDIVVEPSNNNFKRVHYEGTIEGLKEIPKILGEIK